MKKAFFLLLATATLFSCKKDKDPELQGKWTVDNIVIKEYINGSLTSTTSEPGNGMTIDFQSNGNVVINKNGAIESYPYSQPAENLVTFDGDTYEVRNLDENNVILYVKMDWGGNDYDEAFVTMKR